MTAPSSEPAKQYDPKEAEPRWQKVWQDEGVYRFDAASPAPIYSIDTPPPTVSGSIHIGHVFSYTQAEAIARFFRMRGHNVFYPFGFDDNGLPTERFVEKELNVKGKDLPREKFVEHCLEMTRLVEERFKTLWTRLGFSADWTLEYSTIGRNAQRVSQRSFLDLARRGLATRKETPALWCPECQTSVAQAEEDDKESETVLTDVAFGLSGGGEIVIATTRPELLSSCVAVFLHPEDERAAALRGRKAVTPLFGREVPILADAAVKRDKGTGAVMCCTFGDTTDIGWWRDHRLPFVASIGKDGKMTEAAGAYAGLHLKKARAKVLEDLAAAGVVRGQKKVQHAVNVHERCGTPIEFVLAPQWFVNVLDRKDEIRRAGAAIRWFPPEMKVRFDHWVENLKFDWCISRQRFYGVPFPVWLCTRCDGFVLARDEDLPVDPTRVAPPSPCPKCQAPLRPETDVMDTWATSSVTPQINARWGEPGDLSARLYPMSLRPQAHDMLNPQREKISKSKGGAAVTPDMLIEKYSADPVRYWACRNSLGMDTYFDEKTLDQGRRLVTKLWNAVRFAHASLAGWNGTDAGGEPRTVDRAVLSLLARVVDRSTSLLERYEFGLAMKEIESFFWADLCDNYLEMVKDRLYDLSPANASARAGGQRSLARVLETVLKLFAPFLPHVTEELYQSLFAARGGPFRSLHRTSWPRVEPGDADAEAEAAFAAAVAVVTVGRRWKSERNLSMKTPLGEVAVTGPGERLDLLARCDAEVRATLHCERLALDRRGREGPGGAPPDGAVESGGLFVRVSPAAS
jgi:valyl-tRNA synthetase